MSNASGEKRATNSPVDHPGTAATQSLAPSAMDRPSLLNDTCSCAPDPSASSEEAASASDEPRSIGRYHVIETLGRGGQATVFRAVHPSLPREVVLKWSHRPHDVSEESKALTALQHPNLAQIFDLDLHQGRPFLVLEFVRGANLAEILKRSPAALPRIVRLLQQVAEAVHYAHRHGVVHRDLKPANIVVDSTSDVPKVIDWGLAIIHTPWTPTEPDGKISGTVAFMAPEQARGELSNIGPAADVFSLGAILYQALTGRAPYQGATTAEALDRAARCDFDAVLLDGPSVPKSLSAVCRRAMQADPAQRFATAEAFAQALNCFVRPRRTIGRLNAAVALALAVGVIAALLWQAIRPSNSLQPAKSPANESPPPETASPLVQSSIVRHAAFDGTTAEPFAELQPTKLPQVDDEIGLDVKLTAPAYCLLLSLNADGTWQQCHPADVGKHGADDQVAVADGPRTELTFPSPPNSFYLTDGPGRQTFVLLASPKPLPPFAWWTSRLRSENLHRAQGFGCWRCDGRAIGPYGSRQRAEIGPARGIAEFQAFCDKLAELAAPPTEVCVLSFPVLPRGD